MEGNGAKGKRRVWNEIEGNGREGYGKGREWKENEKRRKEKGGKERKGIELYSKLSLIDDNSKNKRNIDSTNDVKKERDTNHINAMTWIGAIDKMK